MDIPASFGNWRFAGSIPATYTVYNTRCDPVREVTPFGVVVIAGAAPVISTKNLIIMENKNEIKKTLYRNKPMAEFVRKEGNMNIYIAEVNDEKIYFSIPDAEMINDDGKKIINDKVEGQLLIRWIK